MLLIESGTISRSSTLQAPHLTKGSRALLARLAMR
jgi:hypothetical protein